MSEGLMEMASGGGHRIAVTCPLQWPLVPSVVGGREE